MAEKVVNGKFTEAQLEKAIIQFVTADEAYAYVNGEEIHREYSEILIKQDLRRYLQRRYMKEQLTEAELDLIIAKLENIPYAPSLYNGNKETYNLIIGGFNFVRVDNPQAEPVHIDFIDFEDVKKNIFKVVNQYSVDGELAGGQIQNRRPDMLIFINGIPMVIWEFKTAIEENTKTFDAWKQITIRYARDIPALLKYCFLAVITDGAESKLGSIFTPYEFFYAWNKVEWQDEEAMGMNALLKMIRGAFSTERLLKVLRDFVYYPDSSKGTECPIVCRYPQFFAAWGMYNNIRKHLKPDGDGKGGVYFGATGSGKTYAMLYLARLLKHRDNKKLNNPTIVIIVDRDDLDSQTSEIFEVAKEYLVDGNVRSIVNREDLGNTLSSTMAGGVYITTIQKFTENTGLLSDRSNIICISDEAHRSQSGTYEKTFVKDGVLYSKRGFGAYLRDAFPNATYCGFTGTPTEEAVAVFGPVVERYSMKNAADDGITVRIAYVPRLARVLVDEANVKKIDEYYKECLKLGSDPAQVEKSKQAMTKLEGVLGNDERIDKLTTDVIGHYEALCSENPDVIKKAMIVCTSRPLAFKVLNAILKKKPEWGEAKKTSVENLPQEELDKLAEVPFVNLVATQSKEDKDRTDNLYEVCGTDAHRKFLEKQFKNKYSNFKIAIVVDMWITGFDVPSLAVMYIDKKMIGHTLIQTISRVNRVFAGKDKGLVVDYIDIGKNMQLAVKEYGGDGDDSAVTNIEESIKILMNELDFLDQAMINFDAHDYYYGSEAERFMCLAKAADYVQRTEKDKNYYMHHTHLMGLAFDICAPTGDLPKDVIDKVWFYKAVYSIVYKTTKPHVPNTEVMNQHVQRMLEAALSCSGVEDIMQLHDEIDLYSEDFQETLAKVKEPNTRFNILLQSLKKAIRDYGKTNQVKAKEFSEKLAKVVEEYNTRDNVERIAEVVKDATEKIIDIAKEMEEDRNSFKKLGITFAQKAFYDILIKTRDDHKFEYADDKCKKLAKEIDKLVENETKYADWDNREDVKANLNKELVILLYENGYPPEWNDAVFEKVLAQAQNFKVNN